VARWAVGIGGIAWWDFCLADKLVLVLFAFVVLGSVSLVLSQEIDWEERF